MFDQLSERLQSTLSEVRSRGKLTESDVDSAMREIRLALLEADVNFKVVKAFTKTLKERCLGSDVLESLDPGQQVVKIVNEELASLMGGTGSELAMATSGPTVILMAGLQGSGKTTACAKLAQFFGKQGKDVALAACDVYRPAAVEQLVTMGGRAGAHVYERGTEADPVDIASWALDEARAERRDVLIVDTAGRLHTKHNLMAELSKLRKIMQRHVEDAPQEVLLVIDATTGQNGLVQAKVFADSVAITDIMIAKLDGTAKGGIAFSVAKELGTPISYVGTGEKATDLAEFKPETYVDSLFFGIGEGL